MTVEDQRPGDPIRPGEGGEAVRSADVPPDEEILHPEGSTTHVSGAVLLSFGAVHPGRERLAVATFTEVSRFLGEMLADGVVESFKPYFFDGGMFGDIIGFFLIEGRREQLDALRRRDDFQRLVLRAGAATANVRVNALVAGTEAGRLVNLYRSVREELGLLAPDPG